MERSKYQCFRSSHKI